MTFRSKARLNLYLTCLMAGLCISRPALAEWKLYYTGDAAQMFGSAGQGSFRTQAECEAVRASQVPFERNRSYCSGSDAAVANGQTSVPAKPKTFPVTPSPQMSLPVTQTGSDWAVAVPKPSGQTGPGNFRPPFPTPAPVVSTQSGFAPSEPPPAVEPHWCREKLAEAQEAIGTGSLQEVADILRPAKASCAGKLEYVRIGSLLDDVDRELAARKKRASYTHQKSGLIGGTGWVLESYFRDIASDLSPEDRAKADKALEIQMTLAGKSKEEFASVKDYDFILGVAVSSNPGVDLVDRVIRDQKDDGRYSPSVRQEYARLKGRYFDVLDCHSNGAMICLAALRNGDVVARKVRLFGPQLSPSALLDWRKMLDRHGFGNKIESLDIVLSERDPVSKFSFYAKDILSEGLKQDPRVLDPQLFGDKLISDIERGPCYFDGLRGCIDLPFPRVIVVNCPESYMIFSINCHVKTHYDAELRRLGIK